MKKNKFLLYVITVFITFITVLSFSKPVQASDTHVGGATYTKKQLKELQTKNPFEMTICEMFLAVGDFVMEYLTFLLKEEVTVQKIIYNRVDALNANFFANAENPSTAPASEFVTKTVNAWYNLLGKIVMLTYIIALVVVGIMTMLGGAGQKAKAQELLIKWTMGIIIFCFFPYVMRYAFSLNEAFIRLMENLYGGDNSIGNYIGEVSDLRQQNVELRSPEYITRGTYVLTLGSEEATTAYINRLEEYKNKGDMMRIMRAMAGVSARIMYVILWYIMLWQLLVFIYVYYKRYLMIAFLLAIFPITLIEYIVGTISTGKQSSLSAWSKEFFINVFLQSIHASIYAVISGVIMVQINSTLVDGGINKINWFLMICAVNFVFAGEKILMGIINAAAMETIVSPGEVSQGAIQGAKSGAQKAGNGFGKLKDMFGGK